MMAPILIDNRGLIKLGLISVLTTVIVFAVGFLSGYQQAITFYAAGSEIETLALPVQAVLLESDVEPQLPDTIVAGAEIDVDQPQVESKVNTKTNTKTNTKISVVESKTSTPSNKEKVNKTKKAATSNKLASLKQDKVTSNNFQNESDESAATEEPDLIVIASLTSAELNNIKYSIQVGMYGRLINAENMMRLLRAQHLDAYVSDYINKKNESRYNVRFGYYVDKKSALSALKKYKNKQKGDGYLVRFSVENMTKLADAKNVKGVTTTEKTKENASPEIMPLEAMPSEAMSTETAQDKVSQADAAGISNILAKALEQDLIVHTQVITEPY